MFYLEPRETITRILLTYASKEYAFSVNERHIVITATDAKIRRFVSIQIEIWCLNQLPYVIYIYTGTIYYSGDHRNTSYVGVHGSILRSFSGAVKACSMQSTLVTSTKKEYIVGVYNGAKPPAKTTLASNLYNEHVVFC